MYELLRQLYTNRCRPFKSPTRNKSHVLHKILLKTYIYFPQFILQHYGKLNTFNKAPFKYTSTYLCKIFYLYGHTVRLSWVSPTSDTKQLLLPDQSRKRLNYLIKTHDIEKDQTLWCQSSTSGDSRK